MVTHRPPEDKPPAPGTTAPALDMGPPPGALPAAFRVTCRHCGRDVVFPWDPILSARLDLLRYLEEQRPGLLAWAAKEVQR
jgi:hypothetical protein